jgi:hypothetical protein
MWESLVAGEPLSELQYARFMTLNSQVIALCGEVVQLMFKASGGTKPATRSFRYRWTWSNQSGKFEIQAQHRAVRKSFPG